MQEERIKPWVLPMGVDDLITRDEIDRLECLAREEFFSAIADEREHQVHKYGSDLTANKPVDLLLALFSKSVAELQMVTAYSEQSETDEEALDNLFRQMVRVGATITAYYEYWRVGLATESLTVTREDVITGDPWMDEPEK